MLTPKVLTSSWSSGAPGPIGFCVSEGSILLLSPTKGLHWAYHQMPSVRCCAMRGPARLAKIVVCIFAGNTEEHIIGSSVPG